MRVTEAQGSPQGTGSGMSTPVPLVGDQAGGKTTAGAMTVKAETDWWSGEPVKTSDGKQVTTG